MWFGLCVEIPHWLFVYYKAASAHDHKLKVINDVVLLLGTDLLLSTIVESWSHLLCMLLMALARSFSSIVVIHYVHLVLRMMSCFHVMAAWCIFCIHKWP